MFFNSITKISIFHWKCVHILLLLVLLYYTDNSFNFNYNFPFWFDLVVSNGFLFWKKILILKKLPILYNLPIIKCIFFHRELIPKVGPDLDTLEMVSDCKVPINIALFKIATWREIPDDFPWNGDGDAAVFDVLSTYSLRVDIIAGIPSRKYIIWRHNIKRKMKGIKAEPDKWLPFWRSKVP